MSIDHDVVGISGTGSAHTPELYLICSPRNAPHANDIRYQMLGYEAFVKDPAVLAKMHVLIGCQIWGNASTVLIGDEVIAERSSVQRFNMRDLETVLAAARAWRSSRDVSTKD